MVVALAAQTPASHVSVSGRVLRGGRDTVPLANNTVVLHRVTRAGGGPIDSTRTDARGRYRFDLRAPDSGSIYVVSAWYDSLAYFSLPVNLTGRPAAHVEDLIAFPTTANTPPIRLERRLATVAAAAPEGTREVLEILELENTGATTRITKDTLFPTWAGRVPAQVGQVRGGQGDISQDAMRFGHDSVFVLGPVPPGGVKQLSYAYTIPAGLRTFSIPIDQLTVNFNLLVEDTSAAVSAPRLASLGVQEIEGHRYAAYRADSLKAGERVDILLPAGRFRAQVLLPYLIGVLVIGMLVALAWALMRKPAHLQSEGR